MPDVDDPPRCFRLLKHHHYYSKKSVHLEQKRERERESVIASLVIHATPSFYGAGGPPPLFDDEGFWHGSFAQRLSGDSDVLAIVPLNDSNHGSV